MKTFFLIISLKKSPIFTIVSDKHVLCPLRCRPLRIEILKVNPTFEIAFHFHLDYLKGIVEWELIRWLSQVVFSLLKNMPEPIQRLYHDWVMFMKVSDHVLETFLLPWDIQGLTPQPSATLAGSHHPLGFLLSSEISKSTSIWRFGWLLWLLLLFIPSRLDILLLVKKGVSLGSIVSEALNRGFMLLDFTLFDFWQLDSFCLKILFYVIRVGVMR